MVIVSDYKININDFTLNLNNAKELCSKLENDKDKNITKKWIEKFENVYINGDSKLCNHYLKLLLLSLKYKILICPFDNWPPNDNNLDALLNFSTTQKLNYYENPCDGPNHNVNAMTLNETCIKQLIGLENFVLPNMELIVAPVQHKSRLRPPTDLKLIKRTPTPNAGDQPNIPSTVKSITKLPSVSTARLSLPRSSLLPMPSSRKTRGISRLPVPGEKRLPATIRPAKEHASNQNEDNGNLSILTDDDMLYEDLFSEGIASDAEMEDMRKSFYVQNDQKLAQKLNDNTLIMNAIGNNNENKIIPIINGSDVVQLFDPHSEIGAKEFENLRKNIRLTNETFMAKNLEHSIVEMHSLGEHINCVISTRPVRVSLSPKNQIDLTIESPEQKHVKQSINKTIDGASNYSPGLSLDIEPINDPNHCPGLPLDIEPINDPNYCPGLSLDIEPVNDPNYCPGLPLDVEPINDPNYCPGLSLDIGPISGSSNVRDNANQENEFEKVASKKSHVTAKNLVGATSKSDSMQLIDNDPFPEPADSTELLIDLFSNPNPKIVKQRIKQIPSRLRERLSRKFVSKEKLKYAGRDENIIRTPPMFQNNWKGKTVKRFKPQEFGLSKFEQFVPADEFFADLTTREKKQSKQSRSRRSSTRNQAIKWPEESKRIDVRELYDPPLLTKEDKLKRSALYRWQERLRLQDEEERENEILDRAHLNLSKTNKPTIIVLPKRKEYSLRRPPKSKQKKAIEKSSSDSENDPYNLTYDKELDTEGLHREYAKGYKKFRKENKAQRESFIAEAFAKTQERIAAEEKAEAEADAAAAAIAAANQSNRGAEIIAKYKIPKIPDKYELPKDKSYKPLEPLIYKEMPDDDELEVMDSELSILVDDDMLIDDVFGDEQIAIPERPQKSLIEFRTPSPSSSEELLSDDEMIIDDVFGENQVAEIDMLPVQKQTEISQIIGLDEEEIDPDPESFEGKYIAFLRKQKLENLRQKIVSTDEPIVDIDTVVEALKARQTDFLKNTVKPTEVPKPVETSSTQPHAETIKTVETQQQPEIIEITDEPTADDKEKRQIGEILPIFPTAEEKRRQADRTKLLHDIQKVLKEQERQQESELRKKLTSNDGDDTRYHLVKSNLASKAYQDIKNRFNELKNLPDTEEIYYDVTDEEKNPALWHLEHPDLMDPHVPAIDENKDESLTIMDKPIKDPIETTPLLEYEKTKPYLDELKKKIKLVEDEYSQQLEAVKDLIYKRNVIPVKSSSEEIIPIKHDLLHGAMESPKKAYHLKSGPALLDESLTEENLHPPLVKEPENFVPDTGLLADEQMDIGDIFGDEQIVNPREAFKLSSSDSSSLQVEQSESMIASQKAYDAINVLKGKIAAIRPLAVNNEDIIGRIQLLEDKIKEFEPIANKHKPPKTPKKRQTPPAKFSELERDAAGRIRPSSHLSPTTRNRMLAKPLTKDEYIEMERKKDEAGIKRLPLTMSPKERTLALFKDARKQKHHITSRRDPNTGRLIFTSILRDRSPSPPPDPMLDEEQLELISDDDWGSDEDAEEKYVRDDGVIIHSPLRQKPLYVPSTSSSSNAAETDSPVAVALTHVPPARLTNIDTSPIGKTWIDRDERGFAWLQELVPMVSGPYIRRRRTLQFTTEPEPQLSAVEQIPSPAKVKLPKKKRVRTTCELLDSTLTEVMFISPRANRMPGEPKNVPGVKPPRPILPDEEVMRRAKIREEREANFRAKRRRQIDIEIENAKVSPIKKITQAEQLKALQALAQQQELSLKSDIVRKKPTEKMAANNQKTITERSRLQNESTRARQQALHLQSTKDEKQARKQVIDCLRSMEKEMAKNEQAKLQSSAMEKEKEKIEQAKFQALAKEQYRAIQARAEQQKALLFSDDNEAMPSTSANADKHQLSAKEQYRAIQARAKQQKALLFSDDNEAVPSTSANAVKHQLSAKENEKIEQAKLQADAKEQLRAIRARAEQQLASLFD